MKIQAGKTGFEEFLHDSREELGFGAVSILPLVLKSVQELRRRLEEAYVASQAGSRDWPDYMLRTAGRRADPTSLFPWAKSLAMFAFPFADVPADGDFLPLAADDELSGLVAGYAARVDYHVFMRRKINMFSELLKKYLGRNSRHEIFVDTTPVAEKSLAAFSGLGAIGLNSCLLCKGQGSGTCLGVLALDVELPPTEPADFAAPCSTCGKCVERCPTGAIAGRPGEFRYKRCRSYLTMEKKGDFNKDEAALVGDWIFGCDICTSLCPGSHPLEALKVDLEWLLLEDDATAVKLINGTALEYPGLKLLRRNALAVLGKRKSEKAQSLSGRFLSGKI